MNTNTTNTTSTNAAKADFFDLHTTGLGYLSRIREVEVKKGPSYLACTIGALRGAADDIGYTYFDCNVVGDTAVEVIKKCEQAVKANQKVLIGFALGDLRAETFTYATGEKKGQTGVSLKGRLFKITWVNIDGKRVYDAPKADADAPPASQDDQPDTPAESTNESGSSPQEVDTAQAMFLAKLAEVKAAKVAAASVAKAAALKALADAEAMEAEDFEEMAAE